MGRPVAVRPQGQMGVSLRCYSLTEAPLPSYGGGALIGRNRLRLQLLEAAHHLETPQEL